MAYTAVDTWDLTAPARVDVTVKRRQTNTPIDGGVVFRRQTYSSESAQGQAAVRVFRLYFANATKAEFNKAMALWANTTGGSQGISFQHTNTAYSGTETIIVRMLGAPVTFSKQAHNQYAFVVELEEMLASPGV